MPHLSILKKRSSNATHYRQSYPVKKAVQLVDIKTSDFLRRNNPHPKPDFLEPKHLKEEDARARLEAQVQHAVNEQMDKTRVREAVQEYLDKVKAEKRNMPPKIPHATFTTMATEKPQGAGMTRSKTMVEMRPKTMQDMIETEVRDSLQRERTSLGETDYHDEPTFHEDHVTRPFKSCSPGPSSPPIRTRVVKRPITPTFYREHWATWRTETPPEPGIRDKQTKWVHKPVKAQSQRVKRVHTPPTPPPGHRNKAMATDMERHTPSPATIRRHMRSKSCPPPQEKPQVYRVRYEDHYDDDVSDYDSRPQTPVRPKTAGPMIAKSMIEHPRMKNWMNGATDYEKEVAYTLLHTLNGGKGPQMAAKTNNIRPRSNSASNTRKVAIPKATPMQRAPSSPNLKSPVLDTKGVNTKSLKTWMKKVEKQLEECTTKSAPPERLQYSTKVDMKSRTPQPPRHEPRIMTPDAYMHENSHFFLTGRPTRGHFVIAPDWVSEGASHRRLLRQAKENQLRRQRQLAISV